MTTPLAARIAREYGTPCAVIDMDRVERNIARIQAACDAAGVANRPHIKTHKSPLLAQMQVAAGARGITCQKLGEAEVMADAGIDDILISHDRDFLDRVVTSVIVPEGDGRWIEYAGGYSDMLLQRRADLSRETVKAAPPAEERKEAKTSAPSPAPKRRLSFNEKHALETLPKTIEKLQGEIAKQQRLLDDPDLYRKNRKKFDEASAAIATAQKELVAAEDRWLELEVLREEIEQA